MKSFSVASSTSFVLPEERVELDLVGEDRRELERLAQHPGGEVRDAEVACISPASRSSASAPSVSSSGTSSLGQCRSRRSTHSPAAARATPRPRRARGRRRTGRATASWSGTARCGHAGGGERLADLGLVLVRLRGVDVAVADLERIGDRLLAVAAEDLPGPESELGDGGPWISRARSEGSIVVIPAPTPAARLLPSGPIPGRLAQLGERRLDKAEVTGSAIDLLACYFVSLRVPAGGQRSAGAHRLAARRPGRRRGHRRHPAQGRDQRQHGGQPLHARSSRSSVYTFHTASPIGTTDSSSSVSSRSSAAGEPRVERPPAAPPAEGARPPRPTASATGATAPSRAASDAQGSR